MNAATAHTPNKFSDTADQFIQRLGHFFMWTNCVLIVAIILQVFLRYGMGRGLVILEELQWHFYGVGFMFGLSYAITSDSHVGMDLLYERLSDKAQARLDIFGLIFLLLPFAAIVFYQSLDFWYESWRLSERSVAPMGLCCRWLIKSVMPLSFAMVILAAVSRLIRTITFLKRA
jgi:TRAP-type mannitol/chloroaromatic compound transport system permease small subunit